MYKLSTRIYNFTQSEPRTLLLQEVSDSRPLFFGNRGQNDIGRVEVASHHRSLVLHHRQEDLEKVE